MRALSILTPLACALSLGACVTPAANPSGQPPVTDACNASGFQGLVGQPRTVLKTMMLPAGTRVIGPGDAVTMDFSPERMNIEIGTDGRIAKIGCY